MKMKRDESIRYFYKPVGSSSQSSENDGTMQSSEANKANPN